MNKIIEIDVNKIFPHPNNPRKELGDLTELSESIKANGIMQNLTVVQNTKDAELYTVIIGHRRLAAAKLAGLETVPCAVVPMDEKRQLATMLAENMQRIDLTVYEQAEGIQLMLDLGMSVSDVSESTGFSESTVRRRKRLLSFDKIKFKATQDRQISLADYERLFDVEDKAKRDELLDYIGTNNFENKIMDAISCQERDKRKKELYEFLDSLPNFSAGGGGDGFFYYRWCTSKSEIEQIIKAYPDGDFQYKKDGYGATIYKKSELGDKPTSSKEEAKRKKREKFRAEAHEINERMRRLRNEFCENPPKLSLCKRDLLVKELLRQIMDEENILPITFDEQYAADGGVNLMLKTLREFTDLSGSNYINCYSLNDARNINEGLNRLYFLLVRLGYEMSDEEKQLRDGTHPIFTKFKEV